MGIYTYTNHRFKALIFVLIFFTEDSKTSDKIKSTPTSLKFEFESIDQDEKIVEMDFQNLSETNFQTIDEKSLEDELQTSEKEESSVMWILKLGIGVFSAFVITIILIIIVLLCKFCNHKNL